MVIARCDPLRPAGHPSDGDCLFGNTYNLMSTTYEMGCRGIWRTSTTRTAVSSYAPPYLTG